MQSGVRVVVRPHLARMVAKASTGIHWRNFNSGELELFGLVFFFAQAIVFVVKWLTRCSADRGEGHRHKRDGKKDDDESERPAIYNFQFAVFNFQFLIPDPQLSISLAGPKLQQKLLRLIKPWSNLERT